MHEGRNESISLFYALSLYALFSLSRKGRVQVGNQEPSAVLVDLSLSFSLLYLFPVVYSVSYALTSYLNSLCDVTHTHTHTIS